MAELLRTHPLEARHPLMAWTAAFARLPATVGITAEPFVAMVDVRLGTVGAEASAALGVDLPTTPNTWVPAGTGRAVWLGPDEWLLTSTSESPEELEARVRAAVLPLGGSATDVSAQRIGLRLTGARVRDVLATGCSIDLHPRVFGRGRSAQTILGQAGIVLLGLSDAGEDFVVLVRSSFAGYLADWLLDAALEFTPTTS
ncbi:sarcosine oxidase subunit gamma [Geodermatophilus sabuli]|uniref:Sarcosine oxidase subunit gamma n=1 Tax=Geodermatophilus sabuli TaxID=1564158 RepID=A0A285EEJ6_9ACTN|nr:sarcosine oxidase subunit gamma family protein [Geodermatophilus sabuli]MBB3084522.1 sarcosine oxidase subunit gamma [Geodermatophilus sabuli]SNX97283.1 sarcosine oxidase subunit gamma [Geodermatophilus sabuli]